MALLALGALGPSNEHDIVGLLTKKLDAFMALERERALIGLGYLGPDAKPALEKITALMNNPDKSVQPQAAFAYWKITGEAGPAMEVLAATLQDYNFRDETVQRLGEMGSVAAPLVPELINLLRDEDDSIRESAIQTLEKLGPVAKQALPKLRTIAKNDSDLLIQEAAKSAIKAIQKR
jgi:HEAT repeat protein